MYTSGVNLVSKVGDLRRFGRGEQGGPNLERRDSTFPLIAKDIRSPAELSG